MYHVDEGERFIERAWPRKDPTVGNDPQKAAQYKIGDSERLPGVENRLEPGTAGAMLRRIIAVGGDEDIDVRQHHCARPSTPEARRSHSSPLPA